jgi:outer membrane protein
MKTIFLSFAMVFLSIVGFSQKFAYIDSEYILSKIPSYDAAKQQLDQYSKEWQGQIEKMRQELDKMYKDYQADKVLLTDDMKKKRQEEIIKKDKEIKDLQRKYFGVEGELFKKRQELIKPIQDDIFSKVKEVANDGGYDMIFDVADKTILLYTNPKYDKSDDVLKKMGY